MSFEKAFDTLRKAIAEHGWHIIITGLDFTKSAAERVLESQRCEHVLFDEVSKVV